MHSLKNADSQQIWPISSLEKTHQVLIELNVGSWRILQPKEVWIQEYVLVCIESVSKARITGKALNLHLPQPNPRPSVSVTVSVTSKNPQCP